MASKPNFDPRIHLLDENASYDVRPARYPSPERSNGETWAPNDPPQHLPVTSNGLPPPTTTPGETPTQSTEEADAAMALMLQEQFMEEEIRSERKAEMDDLELAIQLQEREEAHARAEWSETVIRSLEETPTGNGENDLELARTMQNLERLGMGRLNSQRLREVNPDRSSFSSFDDSERLGRENGPNRRGSNSDGGYAEYLQEEDPRVIQEEQDAELAEMLLREEEELEDLYLENRAAAEAAAQAAAAQAAAAEAAAAQSVVRQAAPVVPTDIPARHPEVLNNRQSSRRSTTQAVHRPVQEPVNNVASAAGVARVPANTSVRAARTPVGHPARTQPESSDIPYGMPPHIDPPYGVPLVAEVVPKKKKRGIFSSILGNKEREKPEIPVPAPIPPPPPVPTQRPGPLPYSVSICTPIPTASTTAQGQQPKRKGGPLSNSGSSSLPGAFQATNRRFLTTTSIPNCSVCNQAATSFLATLDKKFHPNCFRCVGCHQVIDSSGPFAFMTDERGEKNPLHRQCYSELYGVKCAVCMESIPAGADGKISYVKHPFFDTEQMCPKHASNPGRRCSGCHRFEPIGDGFADLGDSNRCVCYSCCRSVVVDSEDAKPLWDSVISFMEKKLRLPIWQDMRNVPILVVGFDALNDQLQNSSHAGSSQIMTRGLCLSEHQSGRRFEVPRLTFDKNRKSFRPRDVEAKGYTYFQVPDADKINPDSSVTAILCLSGLPSDLTASVLAHEATHAWIKLHPSFDIAEPIPPMVEEGCCQLMALLFLNDGLKPASLAIHDDKGPSDAKLRQYFKFSIETDDNEIYGTGYRQAAKAYANIGIEALLSHVVLYKEFPET